MEQRALTLLEEKKYGELKNLLIEQNPVDMAAMLGEFPEEQLSLVFRILPKELAAETFVEMESDEQQLLLKSFNDREAAEVLNELFIDDFVDIVEEMPANVVTRILRLADADTRKTINELLKYPDDSAGSIMTTEYVDLKRDMTVRQAFDHIRRTGVDKETIYTCYVIDASRRLIGITSVKTLLLAAMDAVVGDIMETNIIYAKTLDDKEDVAKMFDRYGFLALPVVDNEQRLVGIVTFDDAMAVIKDEATEDFTKMAAMSQIEDTYFKTSVFKHAKKRIMWLLILMLSATVTGLMLSHYEAAFVAVPVLVTFIPMIMDTGGNCGAQSSTMIIRGMATDEFTIKDFARVFFKEERIALIVGAVLVAVNTLRVLIMYGFNSQNLLITIILAVTMMCTVCLAKGLGCALPMFAKKCGLDPAIMASPLITTIVDACSVFIYFNIAIAILKV